MNSQSSRPENETRLLVLREKIIQQYDTLAPVAERAAIALDLMLKNRLRNLVSESDTSFNPIVYTRVKSKESAMKRVEERAFGNLTKLDDLVGSRIVILHTGQRSRVAQAILELFPPENFMDLEAKYDEGDGRSRGYSGVSFPPISLEAVLATNLFPDMHISAQEHADGAEGIKWEIQVHSVTEEAWARLSHGAFYKSTKGIPASSMRTLRRLQRTLDMVDEEIQRIESGVPLAQEATRNQLTGKQTERAPFEALEPHRHVPGSSHQFIQRPVPVELDEFVLVQCASTLPTLLTRLRDIGRDGGLQTSGWRELVRVGDETDICLDVCRATGIRTFEHFRVVLAKMVKDHAYAVRNISSLVNRVKQAVEAREADPPPSDSDRPGIPFDRPLLIFSLLRIMHSGHLPAIQSMAPHLYDPAVEVRRDLLDNKNSET
ncbi:hypothetical protein [Pseudoclavibacter helvolus]|uniref:hypothetical protein n=1 Tax=Pseudoclavibacter helvolus TaxID=255205 RepID=UPI0009EE03E5|nr:hypothetical protein [Pseudoclavibacter helvolus]